MPDITIYHNSRCSKSRNALQILEEKGLPFKVRNYLQEPLQEAEIRQLLKKLKLPAEALIRKSEPLYKEYFKSTPPDEESCIRAMVLHPQLIERPVVVHGQKAVIARPPEKVLDIL